MSEVVYGFEPFFDSNSRVLILGSFPSVKSRAQSFYYGNPQNSFWSIISSFFGENTPVGLEEKQSLLKRRNIALWDVVTQCEIVGSKDSTIKNYKVADLTRVLSACRIEAICVNGGTAYNIFIKHYPNSDIPVYKLPSTSPANTRPKKNEWYDILRRTFNGT